MAVYHVKSTGTRTSSASTADDWTDANCYATFPAALTASGDGDSVILDDETHTISSPPSAADWNEDKTVESRSGNPELCAISTSSATDYCLNLSPGGGSGIVLQLTGVKITASVTRTADKALVYTAAGAVVTNINFTDCIIGDVTVNIAGTGSNGALVTNAGNSSRTILFTRTKFRNITATYVGHAQIIRMTGASSPSFRYVDCEFTDWNITCTAQTNALIYAQVLAALSFEGCLWRDIVFSGCQRALIRAQDASTVLTLTDADIRGVTRTGDTDLAGGVFINFAGPHTIENIYAEDVVMVIPETNSGGDGVLLYGTTATCVGTIKNVEVHRCNGRSGGAIFFSNGANLVAEGISAYNCEVAHGAAAYVGYNGDMDINGVLVKGCRYASLTADNAKAHGLGIYFRNNPAAPAADSTCNISNVTMVGNDNYDLSVLSIQNDHATATVTATLNNVILEDSNSDTEIEIYYKKTTGTGALTVTTNTCNVKNQGTTIIQDDGTNTTVTDNSLTEIDPNLQSDGSLPVGSALSAAGTRWWTGAHPVDAVGEPLPNTDVDIGGIQGTDATNHPFHPLNL